ncbi:conserved protein of unknown function [Shewanella benthica]|uniref:Uncharacterized protein n=1 Tax=Shewanella benthica TaxID=43661 RepID=A0A330M8T9_9GAMM|nr:hypothetical protein [Shewanella benthica]SQH78405.1 conserved protein of unknown function [Shewanella benthica]
MILTLPLDKKVKARVIAQLSDPSYAIPLGHFLYSFYDRYTGLSREDEFKQHLASVYGEDQLKKFEHSLYHFGAEPTKDKTADRVKEESSSSAEQSLTKQESAKQGNTQAQGIKADRQFIASMVTIYDALVDVGMWQDMDAVPAKYIYLTQSAADLHLVDKMQPIIIGIMSQAVAGMDEGEMQSAVFAIIEDDEPQNRGKVNNKAQALTITLIDFVRLNVLKAYRQFVFKKEREQALNAFFKRLYRDHPRSITQVGISSTPTISVRNLPIIKTGAKVSGEGGTGIPNFHFVARQQDRAYYFFGNDALQLDRIMESHGVRTMFDRLAYLITLNCNGQYDWNAHTSYDGLVNLGFGEAQRDYGEKRCIRELQERAKVEVKLRTFRAEIIEDIRSYQGIFVLDVSIKLTKKRKIEQAISKLAKLDGRGMPDHTLIYNPWPDHFAHFTGPFSDEIIMPTGGLNRLVYNELTLWLPINAAQVTDTLDIVSETANSLSESLDYMVLRECQCNFAGCQVCLIGHRDGARLDELVERRGDKLLYTSLTGEEPRLRILRS